MARILVVTNGLAALLYSSLELARRLREAGHQVTYAGPPDVRLTVQDQGLRFTALTPNRYEEFTDVDARTGLVQRLLNVEARRQEALVAIAIDRFLDTLHAVNPDLVLIDIEMHEEIIAAASHDVPVAQLNSFASIWRQPGLPPPHHLVRPGQGWKGSRIGVPLLWSHLRLRKYGRRIRQRVQRVGCDRVSLLRKLSDDLGFDFRGQADFSQWLIPLTYRNLPVLTLHALEYEFPHTPPRGVHYVGPMVLEDRLDHRVDTSVGPTLEELFSTRQRAAGRQRLIYAGFGSFFSADPGLLARLMKAVGDRRDWNLVISLGDSPLPEILSRPPANVHVFSWVPQVEVLKHSDVVVTHGGIGTVQEGIAAGVPLLVYCGFETDMGGNAARILHHRIGIVGDQHRDDPSTMASHIERLLTEPAFVARAKQLAAHGATYRENHVAERVVESLITS